MNNRNSLTVVKPNELIQNFKNSLNKTEIRIVSMVFAEIKKKIYQDEDGKYILFDCPSFIEKNKEDSKSKKRGGKDYEELRAALKGLSDKSSEFVDFGSYQTNIRLISKVVIIKNKESDQFEPLARVYLDPDLVRIIEQANGNIYAKIDCYFRMKSKYSMKIYELLKSWDGHRSKIFTIEELKSLIGITEEKESYKNYSKFRQAVIDVAMEEINSETDLEVSYEPNRIGRKVESITFFINKKKKKKNEDFKENLKENVIDVDDYVEIEQEENKVLNEMKSVFEKAGYKIENDKMKKFVDNMDFHFSKYKEYKSEEEYNEFLVTEVKKLLVKTNDKEIKNIISYLNACIVKIDINELISNEKEKLNKINNQEKNKKLVEKAFELDEKEREGSSIAEIKMKIEKGEKVTPQQRKLFEIYEKNK